MLKYCTSIAWKSKGVYMKNFSKLMSYAKRLGVDKELRDRLEVLL